MSETSSVEDKTPEENEVELGKALFEKVGDPEPETLSIRRVTRTEEEGEIREELQRFRFFLIPKEDGLPLSFLAKMIRRAGGTVVGNEKDNYCIKILNDVKFIVDPRLNSPLPPDTYSSRFVYDWFLRKKMRLPPPDPTDYLLSPSNYGDDYDVFSILKRETKISDLTPKASSEAEVVFAQDVAYLNYNWLFSEDDHDDHSHSNESDGPKSPSPMMGAQSTEAEGKQSSESGSESDSPLPIPIRLGSKRRAQSSKAEGKQSANKASGSESEASSPKRSQLPRRKKTNHGPPSPSASLPTNEANDESESESDSPLPIPIRLRSKKGARSSEAEGKQSSNEASGSEATPKKRSQLPRGKKTKHSPPPPSAALPVNEANDDSGSESGSESDSPLPIPIRLGSKRRAQSSKAEGKQSANKASGSESEASSPNRSQLPRRKKTNHGPPSPSASLPTNEANDDSESESDSPLPIPIRLRSKKGARSSEAEGKQSSNEASGSEATPKKRSQLPRKAKPASPKEGPKTRDKPETDGEDDDDDDSDKISDEATPMKKSQLTRARGKGKDPNNNPGPASTAPTRTRSVLHSVRSSETASDSETECEVVGDSSPEPTPALPKLKPSPGKEITIRTPGKSVPVMTVKGVAGPQTKRALNMSKKKKSGADDEEKDKDGWIDANANNAEELSSSSDIESLVYESDDEGDAQKKRRRGLPAIHFAPKMPFTQEEEQMIIDRICEVGAYKYTGGLKLFEKIASTKEFKGKRPAVSLWERFRKQIKPKLMDNKNFKKSGFQISEKNLEAFRRGVKESRLTRNSNICPNYKFKK